MARTAYLHIGLPKSGTTFLQTRMWNNRPLLHDQGFLYPGRDRIDHFHATQVVREIPHLHPEHAAAWDFLAERVRTWDRSALISHEFFCIASAEQAKRAVSDLGPESVEVVVTARDYVRQFAAVWQESLKMGTSGSLDDFMERTLRVRPNRPWGWPSQDLPAILARWSEAVPPERIHVITVPPPGAPHELLWERWCEVVGIDDSDFVFDRARANQSLGAAQAALLERVVRQLSGDLESEAWVRHRWLRQYFGNEVLAAQRGDRFALRADHAEELRDLARQAVKETMSGGYQVVGDLQELVPADDLPGRTPDSVSDAEIVEVASRTIEQMIHDVMEATYEGREWRREARRLAAATPKARLAAHRDRFVTRARAAYRALCSLVARIVPRPPHRGTGHDG